LEDEARMKISLFDAKSQFGQMLLQKFFRALEEKRRAR
jgi:hypothetical protein